MGVFRLECQIRLLNIVFEGQVGSHHKLEDQ